MSHRTRRRLLGRDGLLAGLLGLSLLLPSCGGSRDRLVLVVIVDTLRADHLGCYGFEPIETPHIDRLAGEGILYENAITSVPVTLPAVATILTGAHPAQHGLRDNGPYQLDERWVTLAECLRDAGYATGAFVSAAVLSRDHGLHQGFDVYDDDVSTPYVPHHSLLEPMEDRLQEIERRAEVTVDRALEWLATQKGRDVFLMVHLFDPHVPYDPPPPFTTAYDGRLYDGEIAYTDQEVGRLLDGVRQGRRIANVLTVFVADHGEGLGDHDEYFHGDLLFDETIRVPLILHGGGTARGVRIPDVVRTVDLVPTICALQGLEAPAWSSGAVLPGVDAGPSPSEPSRGRAAYIETFRPRLASGWCELRGIRTARWKLVEASEHELYDLERDPREMHDVAEDHPVVRDSLVRLMDATALDAVRRGTHHGASLDLSTQQRERLRSLGYVTASSSRPASSDSMAVWYFPPEERGPALELEHPRENAALAYRRIVANSFFSAGQALLESGRYEEATARFQEALRYNPTFTEAYLGLAAAATRADHPEVAVETLRRAPGGLRTDSGVAVALADALVRINRPRAALQVVEDAIAAAKQVDPILIAKRAAFRKLAGEKARGRP